MSNARSPREVCSTTMGTSGLKVQVSFASFAQVLHPSGAGADANSPGPKAESSNGVRRFRTPVSASRNRLGGKGGGFSFAVVARLGRVQQVARLGVLDADRLRGVDHDVDGLGVRDVLLEGVDAA